MVLNKEGLKKKIRKRIGENIIEIASYSNGGSWNRAVIGAIRYENEFLLELLGELK